MGRKLLLLGLGLFIITAGIGLRMNTMKEDSPSFDEAFHFLQALSLKQSGKLFQKDNHPPGYPFYLSLWMRDNAYEQISEFRTKENDFIGPYQYRMDLLTHRQGSDALNDLRISNFPILTLLTISIFLILQTLGFGIWTKLMMTALLWLEPWFAGLTSHLSNDLLSLTLSALATAFFLRSSQLFWIAGSVLFVLSWLVKVSAIFWMCPLLFWALYKKLPFSRLLWPLGSIAFASLLIYTFDLIANDASAWSASYRWTYLNGLQTLRPYPLFFLQTFINKSSLIVLFLGALSLFNLRKKRAQLRYGLGFIIFSFLFAGAVVPGLGLRLVMPLCISLWILILWPQNSKNALPGLWVSIAVICLFLEAFANRDKLLAYQNFLAGSKPQSLDSSTDWGQGLKSLAQWRQKNPEGSLALSLFGGTPPETFGIENYFALPSFPQISGGRNLSTPQFKGYVAVSWNFREGYIIDYPSFRDLQKMPLITCFRGALCLFDAREGSLSR